MFKYIYNNEGLTLIEVMVALVFLSLGLIPIFKIISASTGISSNIRDGTIAANLAQEGIEVIKAIRDSASMSGSIYDQNLPQGNYMVSWSSDTLLAYDPNAYLKLSPEKIYSYSSGTDTNFRRRINIFRVPSACSCELRVLSEVSWVERGINKTVLIEDHLYDWR